MKRVPTSGKVANSNDGDERQRLSRTAIREMSDHEGTEQTGRASTNKRAPKQPEGRLPATKAIVALLSNIPRTFPHTLNTAKNIAHL